MIHVLIREEDRRWKEGRLQEQGEEGGEDLAWNWQTKDRKSKGKRCDENVKRKGTTARPRRGAVLFSFWGSGSCSITPNIKGSSLKLCLETGAPSLLLSFFLILLFFTVLLSHWKQVDLLLKEWKGDKGTQREGSAMQSAEKCVPTANKQRFFPESAFFCWSFSSIADVVSLLFVTDWGL